MPQETVLELATMGFSSNSRMRPSSLVLTWPKRPTSADAGMSLQTTVISAFFLYMVLQNLVVIQLIDSVTGRDHNIGFMAAL